MQMLPGQQMEPGIPASNEETELHHLNVPGSTALSPRRRQVCSPSDRTTYEGRNSVPHWPPQPTSELRAGGLQVGEWHPDLWGGQVEQKFPSCCQSPPTTSLRGRSRAARHGGGICRAPGGLRAGLAKLFCQEPVVNIFIFRAKQSLSQICNCAFEAQSSPGDVHGDE